MMHFLQNRPSRLPLFAAMAVGATSTAAALLAFGPLSPPAGAVTPTAKPLSDIEPRTAINAVNTPGDAGNTFLISQPGSYYLTGNLSGQNGKTGISITAPNVTIDLNGFTFQGVSGSSYGILFQPGTTGGSVRNGVVRDFGNSAITGSAVSALFEDLRLLNCGGYGLGLGDKGVASRVTVNGCSLQGIHTGLACRLSDCTVTACPGGIYAVSGADVEGCAINSSTSYGISVFNSSVHNCTVTGSANDGILAAGGSLILNNVLIGNGAGDGANINCTGGKNRVERNNCTNADRGIQCTAGNLIIRNTCSGNTVNWVLSANTVYGPIIDRSAPVTPAVSGNSAASTLGSTDPNANFTY